MAGLVLAAGAGRRYGGPKALVEWDGERLVDRACRVIVAGGCRPVVVVSGAVPLQVDGATVVHNDRWTDGMGSSLRTGLLAIPDDVGAAVVMLVDTPWIGAESVRRLRHARARGAGLAIATYEGAPGHPVMLGREHWPGVIDTAVGDVGARPYLAAHPADVIEVDCTGTGDPTDVDVPTDVDPPVIGRE